MRGTEDYRDILKLELADRCKSNPRYSLRSFARDLAISPSRLSRVLNEKEGLSESFAKKIAQHLRLSEVEARRFVALVNSADSRSRVKRAEAQAQLQSHDHFKPVLLDAEIFKMIGDWYHAAILVLAETSHFQSEPKWVAKRLGISIHEAKVAIERLLKLELLEESDGKLQPTHVSLKTTSGIPSGAIRSFTKQIFEKAIAALATQPVEERHFGSLTVALNAEDVPYVAGKIQKLKDEINLFAEKAKRRKRKMEVYNLALGFFRLTEKE